MYSHLQLQSPHLSALLSPYYSVTVCSNQGRHCGPSNNVSKPRLASYAVQHTCAHESSVCAQLLARKVSFAMGVVQVVKGLVEGERDQITGRPRGSGDFILDKVHKGAWFTDKGLTTVFATLSSRPFSCLSACRLHSLQFVVLSCTMQTKWPTLLCFALLSWPTVYYEHSAPEKLL